MSKKSTSFGKKYADVIKNNPNKGKRAIKIKRDAFAEYKKALNSKKTTKVIT